MIKLVRLGLEHVDRIMTWVNDPKCVKNLQHFDKTFTRKDEKDYIEKMEASRYDYVYSIFDGDTYIGQCGIHQISWENNLGRLSMIVKREFWDHGYAHQVLPMITDIAFTTLKLHKVWLMHWKENEKAAYLYEKAGFQAEGILKDEYFWQGRYHDMVRMAIINPES